MVNLCVEPLVVIVTVVAAEFVCFAPLPLQQQALLLDQLLEQLALNPLQSSVRASGVDVVQLQSALLLG